MSDQKITMDQIPLALRLMAAFSASDLAARATIFLLDWAMR